MRELTFHQKQKILAHEANFTAFGRAFIRKAFEVRAELFNKTIGDNMSKYIDMVVDSYVDKYWPMDEYPEQNFKLFLSLFYFNNDWDTRGSDSRIFPGIEELLKAIEPKDVFEFLHGDNLYVYDPSVDVEFDSPQIGTGPAEHA